MKIGRVLSRFFYPFTKSMYRICVVTTPFLPLLLQPTQKLSVRLACASSGRRETGHVFRERPQRLQLGLHWWVPPGPAAALSSQPGRYLSTAERASSRAGITRRHTQAVHPGQCSAVPSARRHPWPATHRRRLFFLCDEGAALSPPHPRGGN